MHPNCRWLHGPGQDAFLHWAGRCVAVVRADGTVHLQGWGVDREFTGHSQALSMRMVERWVARRSAWPGFDRKKVLARIQDGRQRAARAEQILAMAWRPPEPERLPHGP